MSRNVVIAIVAAIVLIVILFLIPWGGEEPVETGAVDVTEEAPQETDVADGEAATEEAAEEPVETIEVEGDAEVVEPEDTEAAETDAAAAGADDAAATDSDQAETGTAGAEGIAGATDASEIDPAAAEQVLTVEGFEYESVVRIIELSDIPDEEQETLRADLEAAQDDEEELGDVLERVRTALEEAN